MQTGTFYKWYLRGIYFFLLFFHIFKRDPNNNSNKKTNIQKKKHEKKKKKKKKTVINIRTSDLKKYISSACFEQTTCNQLSYNSIYTDINMHNVVL